MSVNENTEQTLLLDNTMLALGLLEQPFDSSTDGFSYFVDDQAQKALDEVCAALDNNDTIPIILGQSGSGKTALLSMLIQQTSDSVQYFLVNGNKHFHAFNVFSGMLEAFQESPPDDFQVCLDHLVVHLKSLEKQSLRAVILVDDTHEVPMNELYQLISAMLYMQNGVLLDSFRIAFAAESGFEINNSKIIPTGSNLQFHTVQTPRFNKDSTKQYIEHILYQAGYLEPLPLDRKQLDKIHNLAQGIPSEINKQSAATFNKFLSIPPKDTTYREEKSWISNNPIMGVIAVALVLISGWLFLSSDKTDSTDEPLIITKEPLPTYLKKDMPTRLVLLSEMDSLKLAGDKPKTLDLLDDSSEPPGTIKSVNQKKTKSVVSAAITAPEAGPKITKIKTIEKRKEFKPVVTVKKTSVTTENKTEKTEAKKTTVKIVTKPKKDKSNKEAVKKNTKYQPTESISLVLQSPNWVLMQNPDSFTVQMIASSSRQEVERFLDVTKLPGPNSIFSFKRENETWYALVHGLFTDADDANIAIKSLSKKVMDNHPWIRQIKGIHDALRKSNHSGIS